VDLFINKTVKNINYLREQIKQYTI